MMTAVVCDILCGVPVFENSATAHARRGLEDVISQSRISGYESGAREPPLPVLLKYAEASGVCLDALADDERDLPDRTARQAKTENLLNSHG